MNRLPCRYLWNFVTANIIPRASFSIWEYCFSAGSRDLGAWATAFRKPSGSLWRMQAPMAYELASLATMMSSVRSLWVRERSEGRVFLIFSNDSWHSGVFLIFSNDSWHSGVFLIFSNDSWHSGVFLIFSNDSWHSEVFLIFSNDSWHSGVFLIFSNDSWHSGVFLIFSNDSWHSGVHNHSLSFFKSSLRGPLKFCMFLMFSLLKISSGLGRR